MAGPLTGLEPTVIVYQGVTSQTPIQNIPGAPVVAMVAAANLVAPCLVALNSSFQLQYADASLNLPAIGYITANVAVGATAGVRSLGVLSGLSGLAAGPAYLSTAGAITSTFPADGSGYIAQVVGNAISATSIIFGAQLPIGPL